MFSWCATVHRATYDTLFSPRMCESPTTQAWRKEEEEEEEEEKDFFGVFLFANNAPPLPLPLLPLLRVSNRK